MTDYLMEGAAPRFVPGTSAGVLLLHDLAGSPQMLDGLAEALTAAGSSVDVPLLPGHGTAVDDLVDKTWDDWAAAAQLALDELASRTGPVVVVGVGIGATLGCWVAALHPKVAGIVAVNPLVVPDPSQDRDTLVAMLRDECIYLNPLRPDVSDQEARVVGYDTVPVAPMLSAVEAIGEMTGYWHEVTAPMLIVNSMRDHRVSPENADFLAKHVGGTVERLVLERSFHLATVDVEHRELENAVVDFVHRMTSGPAITLDPKTSPVIL